MPTQLFTGKSLEKQQKIVRPDQQTEILHPYLPDEDLIRAVNVALYLRRPLLLTGEPGSGKSQLARVLAHELYNRYNPDPKADVYVPYVQVEGELAGVLMQDYQAYYEEWNINSNSKAREGLYEYDAIQRLGDSQLLGREGSRSMLDKKEYIKLGPMGRAIRSSTGDYRVVLLIDEIDKADIDFSNDLLNELDRSSFTIVETGETIRAEASPIVVITSNREKELPDAFLRRCVFHEIGQFPEAKLREIIYRRFYDNRYPNTNNPEVIDPVADEMIRKATGRFLAVRDKIKANRSTTGSKSVSTAEFLDWFGVLKYYTELENPTADELLMKAEANKLKQEFPAVPFRQALLKHVSMLPLFNETN